MITSAFTCTGPYAVLIMLGIKRVENRSAMPVPAKGRCAVGCSKSFCKEEFGEFVRWASRALPEEDFERIPAWGDVNDWPGKIVGACNYEARARNELRLEDDGVRSRGTRDPTDTNKKHTTISWDEGYEYWWDLSEVVCFDSPIPCRGNVGMWQMPRELALAVTSADVRARMVGAKVSSAEDAARMFRSVASVAGASEGFFVLPLDADRRALSEPVLVSLGTETTTAVRPSDVLSVALKADADSIVVAHNHPSGRLEPSKDDMSLTAELKNLCRRLDVEFLDHLILGSSASANDRDFLSLQNCQNKTN